ncbi:hypothetical protein [Rahnella woolbedingensis]|uniref:Uncharacterized protein n=1 Tax=Rahnella woolbedingensis TaxID=1510574 RepID=A0A419NDF7_9GAMM|nr:hypothetical protein [Rahnella woolbedingensis]RJT46505.1 hypothetical protein D6C13_04610 [Rahnella woolbedingensis]
MLNKANIKYLIILIFASVIVYPSMANENIKIDPVISLVKMTVEQENLVRDVKCTDYFLTKNIEAGIDLVDVLEKHGGKCKGDPETHPRIFSVYVSQKTHEMASDKDDLTGDGILKPLLPSQ